ncbi:hypothetical protein SBOR_3384 [Sclerotinia borealis F-4128]|uniref:SAP domain-containing protein n=1 Tax=Sclerotinia borealis (strain F-4128) TaxID=1432307 RepID=W9CK33_SCLBF|nr:hypothetical protein SBOR_3384 [Sclerotinia borealis F-4128]
MNEASATSTNGWLRRRSVKFTSSYKEESDLEKVSGPEEEPWSEEELDSEEERHSKPPISPPKTATPKRKNIKTPKPPKTVKPPKAEKIKPPQGARIRTQYISTPTEIFIHPIEATHEDMEGFTLNGEGKLVYQGEANKEDGILKWCLKPRMISARSPSCPERYMTEPPKETLKKWRAYCAFRGLDPSGTREEMQRRLRDHFSAFMYDIDTPEFMAKLESVRLRHIIVRETLRNNGVVSWEMRNEAERTRLWGLLSAEQQFEKNISLFITENISRSRIQDVWVFESRPKFSETEWVEFLGKPQNSAIGLVFTTSPEPAYPNDGDQNVKYQRGGIEEVLYHKPYLGGTWVGTGFQKGMILGRTSLLVKQKIEEMCEQIRKDIIGKYVESTRNSNEQNVDSAQSSNAETWTTQEERHAQALWNLGDSTKKPSHFSYRFGKVAKEPFSSQQIRSPPVTPTPARFFDHARYTNVEEVESFDYARYTYDEYGDFIDHAPFD